MHADRKGKRKPKSSDGPLSRGISKEVAGQLGPDDLVPRFKLEGYDQQSVARRRAWVESRCGVGLTHIAAVSFDPEEMRGNIEGPIGIAQVPLGVAGPVLVCGEHAQGLFYVPMAATEGALIRSYERGMVALSHAGGVRAAVLRDENHIAPAFIFDDVGSARRFTSWLRQHQEEFRAVMEATTAHGKLRTLDADQFGLQVVVRLGFATGDAQGMNMIAKAAEAGCRWVQANYSGCRYVLFSGLCSEKRASGFILNRGKGKWVTAGALLPRRVLKLYLHTTPEELSAVWHATVLGHLGAGSLGFNAHAANGLAAIFVATGQDIATVAHAACAVTDFEVQPDGLYVSITLPALSVATIGGGTGLPTQREALEMMGCYGAGKAVKLAEIVAAAVLGGEVSMGAALAAGDLVTAHERYGRNRPRQGP